MKRGPNKGIKAAALSGLMLVGCSTHSGEPACMETKSYHANGTSASAGRTCSGLKQGAWNEWYSDGSLKWSGHYKNDSLQMHNPGDTSALRISFLDTGALHVGRPARIRVMVGDIHPSKLFLMMTKGTIKLSEQRDLYDYVILPERPGELKLMVQWNNPTNGLIELLGEKRYTVLD